MNRCTTKFGLASLLIVVIVCYILLFVAYPPKMAVIPVPANRSIIILLGGFGQYQLRHLLDTVHDGGFANLVKSNTTVGYVQPIFPTLSLPNFYAMMTGLYAEQHGIVGDAIYSAEHELVIDPVLEKNMDQLHKPIQLFWEQDNFKDRKYKSYVDPCSNVPWLKTKMVCNDDQKLTDEAILDAFESNLHSALKQLRDDELNVAIVHTSAIYRMSQEYGPFGAQTKQSLLRVDSLIKDLLNNLSDMKISNYTNVIVASDHGMASIEKAKHVSIVDIVKGDDVLKVVRQGAYLGMWTADGQRDAVYAKLRNISGIHVWTKDNIPWEFHYRNNDFIAPLQIVSAKGYFIDFHEDLFSKVINTGKHDHQLGADGYDPREVDEMHGVYLAHGPEFFKIMSRPIETKDFYNMTSKLFNKTDQHAPAMAEHKTMVAHSHH